eukprot:snap_masked-scaffold_19-processed-gene-4.20-mRNA-1 protein AED:1.00 eAED:1.00 QI:0/0/0/0/1/1/2/0/133
MSDDELAFNEYLEERVYSDETLFGVYAFCINLLFIILLVYFLPFKVFYLNKIDFASRIFNIFIVGSGLILSAFIEDTVHWETANIILFALTFSLFIGLLFRKNFRKQVIYSMFMNPFLESKEKESHEILPVDI